MNKRNKFNVDDKVYVSNDMFDGIGTVAGFGYGGNCETVYYHIRFEYDKMILDVRNIPEEDLKPIRYNGCDRVCCNCWEHNACSESNYNDENCVCNNNCNENNDNFENDLDDDEIEDYRYNKSCESLDNDKKFNLGDLYDPDEDEKEMIEEIAYDRYIQYESRKLAWEKYKVPMGWKE